jgi:hypothetical protein
MQSRRFFSKWKTTKHDECAQSQFDVEARAVLAVRLFYQLKSGYGLAAIASAGGLGTGLLVKRPFAG